MSKRIYVAGASSNIDQIEHYIKKLQDAGWTISFDWTAPVRQVGDASPDDPKIRRDAALADLQGVGTADVVWLLQPDATSTSTGAWVELGAALTRREIYLLLHENSSHEVNFPIKDVTVVASGLSKKCIFTDLSDYRFHGHDEAFEFINKTLW